MKFSFAQAVDYTAMDGKTYKAIVLGKHTVPAEGDYWIAYEPTFGETALVACWADKLSARQSTMMDLLEKERQRAMTIAYNFMEKHTKKAEAEKAAGNRLYFIENELADECRILGNTISGGDALSAALGETMRDRIEKEYALEQLQTDGATT